MTNKNIDKFYHGTIFYFRIIGFEYEIESKRMKYYLIFGVVNSAVIIIGQIIFNILIEVDIQQRTTNLTYLNYYLVSSAKLISLFYYRKTLIEIFYQFREIYPSAEMEKDSDLQRFLNQSLMIQKILSIFCQLITMIYTISPLVLSLVDLMQSGEFSYRLLYMCWFGFEFGWSKSYVFYGFKYVLQFQATLVSAITILSLDLCLFSSLLQLCLHFDIINKKVLAIKPQDNDQAEKGLREVIVYHQNLLRLGEKLNTVFTPSVLFSLLSSSLIICFTGFNLLGDISLTSIVKAIFLLGYELKQVAITCFLGDKLIHISLRISDAIYEHKWYKGTPKYRRLVLLVLMRSQHRVALSVLGVSDISLHTFRRVMSISYQIFTLLRTG